jgi:hypothetical protein
VYVALKNMREELQDQMQSLEEKRSDLTREMSDGNQSSSTLAGIEARVKEIDARISELDKQIATADQQVANAAAVPGAIIEEPPPVRDGPPEQVYMLGVLFMIVAILPMSLAYARRIWRRSSSVAPAVPVEVQERLDSLTQSVEAISLEVERIGEGQRFMTRVLSETREKSTLNP